MAKEVIESGPAIGNYQYEVIRTAKKQPNEYGAYFYTFKVFKTFSFVKDGKNMTAKDYSIPTWDKGFDEHLAALNFARGQAQKHESQGRTGGVAEQVVAAANEAVVSGKCPI